MMHPVVPFIAGDGIGPDIWRATRQVLDAAADTAYGGTREVIWQEVLAGGRAAAECGEWLPRATLDALRSAGVGIKGPLATEVGGGMRSMNVALRQALDLYACIRPVRHIPGVPAPVRDPGLLDIVIFRENTEDVYAGVEWPAGSAAADEVRRYLVDHHGASLREHSAIGIKPMSEFASKRLIRAAIRHALQHGRSSVTIVHKGNVMKYTEGAFRNWGYEVAREEFAGQTVTEAELGDAAETPSGNRLVIKDRIADAMFQELLLRPGEHSVIATPNLNGDYLSDAAAAQVGGLGIAPGANVGDDVAVFEATHGTAPGLAGTDRANPCSLLLSGAMLFDHLRWPEAAELVRNAIAATIGAGVLTEDLARQVSGARAVSTSTFAEQVARRLE
jgi:isocitrate dehydrogenase